MVNVAKCCSQACLCLLSMIKIIHLVTLSVYEYHCYDTKYDFIVVFIILTVRARLYLISQSSEKCKICLGSMAKS